MLQVSYAIGVAQPLSVFVDTYGTGTIPDKEILAKILEKFDFRPGNRGHPAPRSQWMACITFRWKNKTPEGTSPSYFAGRACQIRLRCVYIPHWKAGLTRVSILCRFDGQEPGPVQAQVFEDSCLWTLWKRRPRIHLGEGCQALNSMSRVFWGVWRSRQRNELFSDLESLFFAAAILSLPKPSSFYTATWFPYPRMHQECILSGTCQTSKRVVTLYALLGIYVEGPELFERLSWLQQPCVHIKHEKFMWL